MLHKQTITATDDTLSVIKQKRFQVGRWKVITTTQSNNSDTSSYQLPYKVYT